MGVDHDHRAAGLEHPVRLGEGAGHHLLVGPARLVLAAAVPHCVRHRLLLLRRPLRGEVLRMEMPDGALEPDVEEVRDVGVGHVVVVGRIGDDGVEMDRAASPIASPRKRRGRPAGDGGGIAGACPGFDSSDDPVDCLSAIS